MSLVNKILNKNTIIINKKLQVKILLVTTCNRALPVIYLNYYQFKSIVIILGPTPRRAAL